MKILVCIKQVPDLESMPCLDKQKGWVKNSVPLKYRMNPFDEYAVEETLRIKETIAGTCVDALSLGPPRVCEALRRALAMGADRAFHIDYPVEGFIPAQTTAKLLAGFARSEGYDLIVAGAMAEDDMQALVGPMIAETLGVSCAVSVVKSDPDPLGKTVRLLCEMQSSRRREILLSMPALITIQSGVNRPRYPSVRNMLRSRTQEIKKVIAAEPVKDCEKYTQTVTLPKRSEKTQFIEGSLVEKAEKLLAVLAKKSFLR
ncbi:MAG: electron transfer flavoprotein subunit beta/FixA family protein [Syntrophobacteraceae bacterium]